MGLSFFIRQYCLKPERHDLNVASSSEWHQKTRHDCLVSQGNRSKRPRGLIALSIAFVMLLTACTDQQSLEDKHSDFEKTTGNMEVPKKVWTTQLVPTSQGIKRHLTGTIQAADAVSISFEVAGVVSKMHVDLGQAFGKGDLLAELDKSLYLLAVQQRKSALGEANAALVDANQTFERSKTLRNQGLVSQAAYDSATANYNIAQQRVDVAQSALDIAKEDLADTQLIAPYAGRVSARLVEPSQQISAGTSVFSIQGNANLEVSAAIPEGLIGKVTLLDKVQVVVPSLSSTKTYAATLSEIGAQASIANAFPITITFDEHYPGFYPGMSAEIILSVGTPFDGDNYFDIPFSAFTTDKTGPYIYLVAFQQRPETNKDTPIQSTESQETNKDTPCHLSKAHQSQTAFAKKHYIEVLELKPQSATIKFLQPPNLETRCDPRIVRTGLDFLRPNQAISVVETSTQIYNQ